MSPSTDAPFPRLERALALRTFLHLYACRLFGGAGREPLDQRRPVAASTVAVHREVEGDLCALAPPAHDLEVAAVKREQPLDDRQAEARAGVATIVARPRLEERIADLRQILRINADPVVLDRDHDRLILRLRPHSDAAARIAELDRIC